MRAGRAYAATLAKDLVGFEVGSVSYAVEVARIREIVRPLPVADLPRRRAFVRGVAEYRDLVVPVVDLRALFELEPQEASRRTKWVIVETAIGLVALVVDAVLHVFSSAENLQRALPPFDPSQLRHGIRSAYRHDDRLVFLLDVDHIAKPADGVASDPLSLLPPEGP